MRKSLNPFFFLVFALVLSGCFSTRKAQQPPQSPKPEWVQSRPTSPLYYYGIGAARKTADVSQYQQAARQSALADMAGEISINISSNSLLHAFESNLSYREDFTSIIRAQTQQELEGYEMMDSWDSADSYWVFYRLSKSHYQQLKEQKKSNAVARSLDFFSGGINACDAGNIRQALVQLVKALEPIKPYFSEPLPVEFRGAQIYLGNEVYKELSATLSGLEIVPLQGEVSVKTGKGIDASSLRFQSRFRTIGNVADLPLIVTYSEKPLRNNRKRTDRNGIASFEVDMVRSAKSHETLLATVDMDEILNEGTTDPMIRRLVSRLSLPEGSIRINIAKPTFAIVDSEVNMGEALNPGPLYNVFIKKAMEMGYVIKDKPADADYIVHINTLTRSFGKGDTYKNVALEGHIKVETPEGKRVYYKALEGFSGRHYSEREAGLEAIKEAQRRFEVTYFREICEAISKP